LNSLSSQKKLLILESELNRFLIKREVAVLTSATRKLSRRSKRLGVIVSLSAVLIAELAAFRKDIIVRDGEKLSWMETLLNGLGIASTLWPAFRSPDSKKKIHLYE